MVDRAAEWAWWLMGQLGPECSLYDSYILFSGPGEALWYFLCLVLGGLFATLFLKKEGA